MKKIFLLGLLLAGLIVPAYPQATSHTAFRFQQGASKPATPAVGDVWTDTSTSPAVDYVCLTAGAWTALSTGSGAGTPGGAGTALQYRIDGTTFGGVLGSLVVNTTAGAGANLAQVSLNQTYTSSDASHSLHLFEPTVTFNGSTVPNTLVTDYNTLIYQGSAGALHIGVSMHRGQDGGSGVTPITNADLNYSDWFSNGTPTDVYTKLTFYNAAGGTVTGGAGNAYTTICGFCYTTLGLAGSTAATLEEGMDIQMPSGTDTHKTSFIGNSIGGGRDAGNYDAQVIAGGMSYFKDGIKQSLTIIDTSATAPMTTGGITVGGISSAAYQTNFTSGAFNASSWNSLLTLSNGATGSYYGSRWIVDNGGNGLAPLIDPVYAKCSNTGGATTTECDGNIIDTPQNSGTYGVTRGLYVKTQVAGVQTATPVAIETAGAADLVKLAGPTITNGGHGISLTSQTTIAAGAAVKIDTANNSSAVLCAITDTTGCSGFAQNAATAGQTVYVLTTGNISTPILGTGTCTKGQFVINDSTTAGRVKCTSTYAAGTVLGWVSIAQAVVGSAVGVDIQVR